VNTNYFNIPADGSSFPTQIQFNNIVTPSLTSTLVSRNIRLLYRLQVSYPTANSNFRMPKPTYTPNYQINSMLRSLPVQSCTDSLSLVINGATTTINSRQVISAVQRQISKEYLKNQASEVPSMADNRAILLADTVGMTGSWSAGAGYPADGTVVNVAFSNGMAGTFTAGAAYPAAGTFVPVVVTGLPQLSAYWIAGTAFVANQAVQVFVDQDCHSEQPLSKYEASSGTTRASFRAVKFTQDGGLDTYEFEVSEPLLISPLVLHDDEVYLSNINTLSVQINYSALNDILCNAGSLVTGAAAGQYNPASVQVSIIQPTPQLQLTYIQVDPAIVQIPRAVSYHYENVVYFPKTTGALPLSVGGGANTDIPVTTQLSSDTIRFQTMPSLIYVFARVPLSARVNTSAAVNYAGRLADSFLPIGDNSGQANCSVQIGTRTGLLASASTKTLYRMAKRNGYNSSWEDWSQGSGSLLIIDPVADLGVNIEAGDVVPGEASGNVNFQIQMMVNNSNYLYAGASQAAREAQGVPAGQTALELMIVAVYSGTATITPDGCLYNLGELSPAEVSTLVRKAPRDGSMVSSEMIKPSIQGGSLLSKFKSILGQTARGIQAVAAHPMVGKLAGGKLRR